MRGLDPAPVPALLSESSLRDRVLPGRPAVKARAAEDGAAPRAASVPDGAWGGVLQAAGSGEDVEVWGSPSYPRNQAALQSYADFVAGLVHGPELASVTVYVAPQGELERLCESSNSAACYDPREQLMIVPGDADDARGVVAHEYGHHVAENSDNFPWPAGVFGPKRWATSAHVCFRWRAGTYWPGDEGAHYRLNPGEGWAETYRALNREGRGWTLVSGLLRPGAAQLAAARRDVLSPWEPPEPAVLFRRFSPVTRQLVVLDFRVPLDGRFDVRIVSSGSLDADTAVGTRGRMLKYSAHYGRREHLRYDPCGLRLLRLVVGRDTGTGTAKITVSWPR